MSASGWTQLGNPFRPQKTVLHESEFPSLSKTKDSVSRHSINKPITYSDKLKCVAARQEPSSYARVSPNEVKRENNTTVSSMEKKKSSHTPKNDQLKRQGSKQEQVSVREQRKVGTGPYKPGLMRAETNLHNGSGSVSKTSSDTKGTSSHPETHPMNGNSAESEVKAKKKKKRKSKVKRQVALQSGKITILTQEAQLKLFKPSVHAVSPRILADINNTEEYPELGRKAMFKGKSIGGKNEAEKAEPQPAPVENSEEKLVKDDREDANPPEELKESKHDAKEAVVETKVNKAAAAAKSAPHVNSPIALSFYDMLLNSKQVKVKNIKQKSEIICPIVNKMQMKKGTQRPHNFLDSSSPFVKRGKEREKPKTKRKSTMKKIILLERQSRREKVEQLKEVMVKAEVILPNEVTEAETGGDLAEDNLLHVNFENDESVCHTHFLEAENCEDKPNISSDDGHWLYSHSEDDLILNKDEENDRNSTADEHSENDHPNCDTEPIVINNDHTESLTESFNSDVPVLSENDNVPDETEAQPSSKHVIEEFEDKVIDESSDVSDGVNAETVPSVEHAEDAASSTEEQCLQEDKSKAAKILIHSRVFREYCTHFASCEINDATLALLGDLARFQDRMHQKDPVKARMKRRLTYGIREVTKHLKLRKLKCVIIATDIENVEAEGGLNDALNEMKTLSAMYYIPCVFSLTRRAMGRVCRKPSPVSVVGLFNYDGAEANFRRMLELQEQSREDYVELHDKLAQRLSTSEVTKILTARNECPEDIQTIRINILGDFFQYQRVKMEDDKH